MNIMHIIIVEDNALLLENLRLLLQGEAGVRAVKTFTSAEEALKADPWKEATILLVDIDLPGISGVELVAQVKAKFPDINCMAYTI
jgi:DNA-binding NarL/FixJ family response regulator